MAESPVSERLKAALADHYRIEREIGSGGMATVYLAQDLKHERQVAVKVLDPGLAETLGAERFLREIKTAANLTHPHILPVHDSGEADGFLFYVMPYVEGESLRSRLTKEKQLPVEDALQITREIADALAYAHEKGVIHRDVKPANIMLEAGHAVLADFGVAHAVAEAKDERITRTGTSLGTPAYMSPEQAAGEWELDGRSDQYALACVLYEMLAGQPPFTGAQVESVVRQHLTAQPPDVTQLRASVPPKVADVVAKALSKAPADRFGTAAEFADVLTALSKTPSGSIPAASQPRARLGWRSRLLALGAVAAIAAILWRPWTEYETVAPTSGPPPWAILGETVGSADEEIRGLMRGLLSGDISASGAAEVVDDEVIREAMAIARMPDTTRLTPPVARELAERGRIATVFVPELDQVGDHYVLTVQVLNAEGGNILDTKRVTAADDNALISASRSVVDSLRPALVALAGEGVRPPRFSDFATTRSIEALRKSRQAGVLFGQGRYQESIDLDRAALEIDPEYARAWSRIGNAYNNLGMRDSAVFAWREALKYPEGLTEIRRGALEVALSGDPFARFKFRDRLYRQTGEPSNQYAIALADDLGRYEDAAAIFEELNEWAPFGVNLRERWNWAGYLLALGRVEGAKMIASGLEGSDWELPMQTKVALMDGNWPEAEQLAAEIARDPARNRVRRSDALRTIASARAAQGRVREALNALDQMMELNKRPGRVEVARWSHLNILLLTTSAGSDPDASYLEELKTDTTHWTHAIAGLWAAEVGDTALARSYLHALPVPDMGEFDLPTVQGSLLAALRGRLAGLRGDWDEAVGVLEPVTGLRSPRHMTSTRLPNWIRAEAEEELGHLDEAAELYSQIAHGYRFGDYEVPGFGLTYSFAHRKAALLYGQLGARERAMEHWRAFLDAVTQPDPEFEWMVEEARAELARPEG